MGVGRNCKGRKQAKTSKKLIVKTRFARQVFCKSTFHSKSTNPHCGSDVAKCVRYSLNTKNVLCEKCENYIIVFWRCYIRNTTKDMAGYIADWKSSWGILDKQRSCHPVHGLHQHVQNAWWSVDLRGEIIGRNMDICHIFLSVAITKSLLYLWSRASHNISIWLWSSICPNII